MYMQSIKMDKVAKNIQWRRIIFPINVLGKLNKYMQKKKTSPSSYIINKIYLKMYQKLKTWYCQTLRIKHERSSILVLAMNFLHVIPKAQTTKKYKYTNRTTPNSKIFCTPKGVIKYKDNKQNGRQYLQTTSKCLISKIYKEFIKT